MKFDILLFKSQNIKFDNANIYIASESNSFINVPLGKIKKIERKFYFFYKLEFSNGTDFESIYFFISPNPPIKRPREISELLKSIESNENI